MGDRTPLGNMDSELASRTPPAATVLANRDIAPGLALIAPRRVTISGGVIFTIYSGGILRIL